MPDGVGDLADHIAATVLATPGVSGLHPGMFGEVGTYLPGRRVTGVRVAEDAGAAHVDVHLIVDADSPLRATAAAVRAAVAAVVPGSTVNVTVEDIAVGDVAGR